ncbi:MAG: glycosyl transferase family 2 [Candidatus Methanoperedenaceae archaeon]|nr:MAG: glycosyl transferase family 2 [Candidatus Methanoperedenaceae archaeon]
MSLIQLISSSHRILKNEGAHSLFRQAVLHFKFVRKYRVDYNIYLKQHQLTEFDLIKMKDELKSFKYNPKISIITPVYNVDNIWLEKAIISVINQVYENWELGLVDDASMKPHIRETLEKYHKKDSRIKTKYLIANEGISGASNEALSLATGEFTAFLDHDDELPLNALFEVAKFLQEHPDADMIYSDEDHITTNGKRIDPYFKPDWSPDLLLSNMYTCHFGVYRRKLIKEIGGFRKGFEGSQDYDMVLRLTERTDKICHIPKILYHWRNIPGSTALRYQAKSYADASAKKALEEGLERRNIRGVVVPCGYPGYFRVKREIIGNPGVSIIIPTKDGINVLRKCIESIEKITKYTNYEIIIIDNNSKDPRTLDYMKTIGQRSNIRVLRYEKPFNFSAINNFAARHSKNEYLLFLNDDTEVISEEWLSSMLEHVQRKEVGAVGCKLLYPDNMIQHAGLILGISGKPGMPGVAGHEHKHLPDNDPGYFRIPHVIHNVSAVTAACIMIRKEVFEEVMGFDENLTIAFNDVDLCLRIREKGYLIVYTPYSKLYHHESFSRGYEDTPEKIERFSKEFNYMREKWGKIIDKGDPYYNPNLSLEHEDFRIRI